METKMDTLDIAGGLLVTAVMVLVVNVFVAALEASRTARLFIVAAIGLWIGLQVTLATAGVLETTLPGGVPLLGVMFVLPPIVLGLAALAWPAVRAPLLALPMPLLIGLNATRFVGLFFVLLAASGRMGGPFPHAAGWGDIITAAFAVPLAVLVARRASPTLAVFAWNAFGLADLVLALLLGAASFGGLGRFMPISLGGEEIASLPWAMIPTVLVPLYLIMHGIIFAQLAAAGSRKPITLTA
jgi:hypothetical protein